MPISNSEQNPFAAPKASFDDEQLDWSDANHVRQKHIQHEANIRSIAHVYLFFGGICTAICIAIASLSGPTQNISHLWSLLFATLSVAQFTIAAGLSRRRKWARMPATVLSAIIVVAFPIGTVLGPYFIYLLLDRKSETVFSDNYRSVISQTQHIRGKTPMLAWVLLSGVLLAICGLLFLSQL